MTKTTSPPEDNNTCWDTVTGANSSNDRLVILRQNVEINSNSYDVFSGIKSSTTWNGNAIAQDFTKKVQRYFKHLWYTIYYGLSNDHQCNSSFIYHYEKIRHHNGSAVFGKMPQMCRDCPDVNKHRGMDTAILGQRRPFMSIKSFVQHSGWQEMVSLCSLIRLLWSAK